MAPLSPSKPLQALSHSSKLYLEHCIRRALSYQEVQSLITASCTAALVPAHMSDQRICKAIASTLVQQDYDAGLSDAQVAEFLNLIEKVCFWPGQEQLWLLVQSVVCI